MTRKQRRLSLIGAALGVLALAVALVLGALKDSIVFFNSPTDVAENHVKPGDAHPHRRLGEGRKRLARGEPCGSLRGHRRQEHRPRGLSRPAAGSVPGRSGIVAEGALDPMGTFRADSVLAKHDENYMPKEVADSLKKQGHWKDEYERKQALRDRAGRNEAPELRGSSARCTSPGTGGWEPRS